MGAKSTYNATTAAQIIASLSEGVPLAEICRQPGMPGLRTVYDWRDADAEFAARFARAREAGFDHIAQDCMTIADDREDDPASRRVRVETRLKLLAKWDPKRYGDLLKLGGDDRVTPLIVQTGVPRTENN